MHDRALLGADHIKWEALLDGPIHLRPASAEQRQHGQIAAGCPTPHPPPLARPSVLGRDRGTRVQPGRVGVLDPCPEVAPIVLTKEAPAVATHVRETHLDDSGPELRQRRVARRSGSSTRSCAAFACYLFVTGAHSTCPRPGPGRGAGRLFCSSAPSVRAVRHPPNQPGIRGGVGPIEIPG